MTADDIQKALVGYYSFNTWSPLRVTAARNCYVVGHEADLTILSASDWIYEIEIKVSVSDFRNESKSATKIEKHIKLQSGRRVKCKMWNGDTPESIVRRFYYAMPKEIYEKVKDEIPEYAGVIVVEPHVFTKDWRAGTTETHNNPRKIKEAKLLPARKASESDRQKMKDAVYFAYWKKKCEGGIPF